jgi:CO dehydrogenase maturation factor
MEAGLEHMGRGTAEHVETMLIVTDSSLKSLEIAKKLHDLAKQMGIKQSFLVGNKVANQREGKFIEQFAKQNEIELLGLMPFDEKILKADMQGETPLKYASQSISVMAIQKLGEKLLKTS